MIKRGFDSLHEYGIIGSIGEMVSRKLVALLSSDRNRDRPPKINYLLTQPAHDVDGGRSEEWVIVLIY
jgi:hypothetical protein